MKHKKKKEERSLAPVSDLRKRILSELGMVTFLKPHKCYIDLGDEDANAVFGSPMGLPSGKVFELAGVEHAGKTLWNLILMRLAQKQHNAFGIWIDLEGTWDKPWAKKLRCRLDEDNFYLIQPLVVKLTKKSKGGSKKVKARNKMKQFLQTIEWQFKEAENVMAWVKEKWPDRPIFVCFDSVANMQTELQLQAGATDQNQRTAQERAQFLSTNLPRWTQLIMNYDAWVVFINQIRTNPAKAFGNPEYTPGGKALAHNAHSRVWLRKLKGGELLKGGRTIGIKGKAINMKNKVGSGSEAYHRHGFQINWTSDDPVAKGLKFMDIKEAERD